MGEKGWSLYKYSTYMYFYLVMILMYTLYRRLNGGGRWQTILLVPGQYGSHDD